jgi:hypothetical protein
MNMPIEMGMALYHALQNQLADHRCAFFVPTAHDYRTFASDLAGLDPRSHENRPEVLVAEMYDWLRSVVPHQLFNSQPTVEVVEKFAEFRGRLDRVHGSTDGRRPSHNETREVMYLVCSECGWWDWRETRLGREEFQSVPIAWRRDEKPDRTLLNGA